MPAQSYPVATRRVVATVPEGDDHHDAHMYDVRTPFQRETVLAITSRPDFCHAFPSLGFEAGVGSYTGPFFFGWYDTSGVFHGTRIGASRVLHEWRSDRLPVPGDELNPAAAALSAQGAEHVARRADV